MVPIIPERFPGLSMEAPLHFPPAPNDRELSSQIFASANLGLGRIDFLHKICSMLIAYFECDGVELWVREGGNRFRCEMIRRPEDFRVKRIRVAERAPRDNPSWENVCAELLDDGKKLHPPGYTRKDVFWISNPGEGQPSVAVTPLEAGSKRVGVLIIKSNEAGLFRNENLNPWGRIAQVTAMALMNQRARAALQERIKELSCLYEISQIMHRPDIPLPEVFQALATTLPPAWQYPEITSARIIFDEQNYTAGDFQEGPFRQGADLVIRGRKRGGIEVAYATAKPEMDEGPFLREERNLIDTVARQIALFIEKKESAEEKELLQEQLRHADRLATVGNLAAGMAHELNEPLGSILGFAQLSLKSPGLPSQAAQDMKKIITAALHAREVVKKLMLFARQMPPRKTRLNLNQVLREGLFLFEARCVRQGIDLVLSLSPEIPEIHADSTQLTQVLTNLVVNAMQAMPRGGKLLVQTRGEKDFVSLVIEDTGEGMSKEVLQQIFLPFFTTKDVDQGTGLGLPVVHGIVTAHQGSIKVESREGQGTRFEICLPAASSRDDGPEENKSRGKEQADERR